MAEAGKAPSQTSARSMPSPARITGSIPKGLRSVVFGEGEETIGKGDSCAWQR